MLGSLFLASLPICLPTEGIPGPAQLPCGELPGVGSAAWVVGSQDQIWDARGGIPLCTSKPHILPATTIIKDPAR